ncbi:hypothetical protein CK203_058642 [Vitis vinifera]|uniref:Uncharacterized protein n=1 Tax=Vitis vinifera TaxID=29760 RepID=A0A438FTH3_VITVI|nr:hypothetical protein CK203_058642 [Vitis vinifera]
MWRTLQKQGRKAKQREQSTAIQGAKISHDVIQGAKIHFKRRYPTRRPPTDPVPPAHQSKRPASRPPAKRTKFSGPGEPSQAPQAEPPKEDSQILVGIPLETVIRRPMIAGPPIEGNLDCRDRSFHSETFFDVEALRQQPELRDSFRLLQRRQGAIGARHIAEALRIPYEPVTQADFREWSSFSQRDMVRILSRGLLQPQY